MSICTKFNHGKWDVIVNLFLAEIYSLSLNLDQGGGEVVFLIFARAFSKIYFAQLEKK